MPIILRGAQPSDELDSGNFALGLSIALSSSLTLWTTIIMIGQWLLTLLE